MEPESHRLDRASLLRDRLAVSKRVRREVDEAVAAAAEKRRAYLDRFIDELRFELHVQQLRSLQQLPPIGAATDRESASRPPAAPLHPESLHDVSKTHVAEATPRARAVPLVTQAEREHSAPAETQQRRGPSERGGTRAGDAMAQAPGTEVEHSPDQLAFDLDGHRGPGDETAASGGRDPDGGALDRTPGFSELVTAADQTISH